MPAAKYWDGTQWVLLPAPPQVVVSPDQPSPRSTELLWMDTDEAAPGTLNVTMDSWHVVGQAGEPVFENSWVWFGGLHATPGFRKFPDGKVKLRGMIKGGAVGTRAFTLPAGYRPPATVLCAVETGETSQNGRIDVLADGSVNVVLGVSSGWFSLNTIEFDTESVLQTTSVSAQPMDSWHVVGAAGEPAFVSPWANYGGGFAGAAFRKGPDGKVALRGLVAGGATNTVIFTLPVGYRPPAGSNGVILPISATNTVGEIRINNAGAVTYLYGPTSTYVSLDAVEFDTESVSSYASGVLGPQRVTALPANPVDGQEIYYVADATNGVLWHLRYNAASVSAYKWEFVGGSNLYAADFNWVTGIITSGTGYTWLNWSTPQITLPLAGDYDIQHAATVSLPNVPDFRVQARRITPSASEGSIVSHGGNSTFVDIEHRERWTGQPAGAVFQLSYSASVASVNFNVYSRNMSVCPVRVG
jgi:hypothetical protein